MVRIGQVPLPNHRQQPPNGKVLPTGRCSSPCRDCRGCDLGNLTGLIHSARRARKALKMPVSKQNRNFGESVSREEAAGDGDAAWNVLRAMIVCVSVTLRCRQVSILLTSHSFQRGLVFRRRRVADDERGRNQGSVQKPAGVGQCRLPMGSIAGLRSIKGHGT